MIMVFIRVGDITTIFLTISTILISLFSTKKNTIMFGRISLIIIEIFLIIDTFRKQTTNKIRLKNFIIIIFIIFLLVVYY
jgi:hypothetical protein